MSIEAAKQIRQYPYDIAAYIWPAYTGREPRAYSFWPDGEGEWQSVRSAGAKFEGHDWPRQPLLGYQDEADPEVMAQQIDVALTHGVNVFIYDWYWYDRRPFLEHCLNEGFLKAPNQGDMRFYLMWANHDANLVWDKRLADTQMDTVVWQGAIDQTEFNRVFTRVIEQYFSQPNYYCIADCPVFSIYDIANLIDGLGGLEATKEAILAFRAAVREAGFPDLHLQLIVWSGDAVGVNRSGVDGGKVDLPLETIVERLGFNSLTNYQFVHMTDIDRPYDSVAADIVRIWDETAKRFAVPYFPHVSIGWDNNPRFQSFRPGILRDNTPQAFGRALEKAACHVDRSHLPAPLITINSWNEWTESSYLLPDSRNGYAYLEAVKKANRLT